VDAVEGMIDFAMKGKVDDAVTELDDGNEVGQ